MILPSIVIALFLFFYPTPTPVHSAHSDSDNIWNEVDELYKHFEVLRTPVDEYRWPTADHLPITSAFADFRLTHFHAGIDVSTFGKIGFPVYASRKGSIVQISVSPSGYGKMILIKHDDGYYTRYAHLQKFYGQLETLVRERQRGKGIYPINIIFEEKELIVETGEQIAYTGDTGAGDAHLHFEILDEHRNPVDPLLFPAFAAKVKDVNAPEFRSVSFDPLTPTSSVNGSLVPVVFDVKEQRKGEYILPTVLDIRGRIGVAVKAVDRLRPGGYRNPCKYFECYLNDQLIFTSSIKRVPLKDTHQIAMYYDYELHRSGYLYYQKLYIEPGNRLPFYNRKREETGIIETSLLPKGTHTLRIVGYDAAGNTSVLKILFSTREETEYSSTTSSYTFKQPPPSDNETKHRYITYDVIPFNVVEKQSSLEVSIQLRKTYIVVDVSSYLPFTKRPSLWFESPSRRSIIDISAIKSNYYTATIPFTSSDGGRVVLEAIADINGAPLVTTRKQLYLIPIVNECTTQIKTALASFTFAPFSVYQSLLCHIDTVYNGYTLQLDAILIDKDVDVEFMVPNDYQNSKVGIFHNSLTGMYLLDWTEAGAKKVLKGKMQRFLGEILLITDDVPPIVEKLEFRYRNGVLRFVFRIKDEIAGVNAEELRITIDNEPVIAEYDPYRGKVFFNESLPLTKGDHIFQIVVEDKMKNSREYHYRFSVK